jgi:ubiquitin-conjugating enzyme E2 Z
MVNAGDVISKNTLKRIISDISDIMKNPLHDNGIYYEHDDENILRGYVLIIPQSDNTPYQYGNYLFCVDFPSNYPYAPPKMTFLTNNGTTRFHPNLYRNGKVCLSLLNTWKGEQWTSCNTLSSVLLNVATLFTDHPFLHEPGITENHVSFYDYTTVIKYENYNTAIYGILTNLKYMKYVSNASENFMKVILENYNKHKEDILKDIGEIRSKRSSTSISIPFYHMFDQEIAYSELYLKLKEYNNTLV